MKQGWEIKKIKDICDKASSNIAQNKITELDGDYPVYGASGFVQNVDFYHRDTEYIGIVKDGSGVGRVNVYPAYSSLLGTLQYILPKNGYALNYVAYALKSLNLASFTSGAAIPHIYFRDYGEVKIAVPSLAEQERIVEILDSEFERIDALKANAEQNLQHAKDLFQAALRQELQPKEGWETKTIRELSEELFAGGDVPKHALSKTITTEYNVPIYANAVEQDGLYGYTNVARVNKPSITIAGRGSGTGYIIERTEKYLPVVRLIVIVPQTQIVRNRFLYYALKSLDIKSNGSAIPQLTVPMIAQYIVNYPTLTAQDVIIGVLDELNERCKALEDNYKKTIALCDDMKQALLRKAFNGEL